jgi:hypothetical protein
MLNQTELTPRSRYERSERCVIMNRVKEGAVQKGWEGGGRRGKAEGAENRWRMPDAVEERC